MGGEAETTNRLTELPGFAHLASVAQASSRWRLGKKTKALKIRVQVSAHLHLDRLHPLVRWVHGFSYRPAGQMERDRKRFWKKNGNIWKHTDLGKSVPVVLKGPTCLCCRRVCSAATCREPSSVWITHSIELAGWCHLPMLNLQRQYDKIPKMLIIGPH